MPSLKELTVATLIVITLGSLGLAQSVLPAAPGHCSVERHGKLLPYPESMKGSGIQGTILLEVIVGIDGCARGVTIVRGLDANLDQLAKQAVDSWKFQPATKDGKPVAVKARIEVEFKDPGK